MVPSGNSARELPQPGLHLVAHDLRSVPHGLMPKAQHFSHRWEEVPAEIDSRVANHPDYLWLPALSGSVEVALETEMPKRTKILPLLVLTTFRDLERPAGLTVRKLPCKLIRRSSKRTDEL